VFYSKYFKIIEKIKYIIKIYYIINYTLVKIINNFDFFNKTSGQSYVKKIKYQIFRDGTSLKREQKY
jgi:hypothetical protein